MSISKYSHSGTENLKITYLLGAGASYYSNPIWKEQGKTMFSVAKNIIALLKRDSFYYKDSKYPSLRNNMILIDFFNKLERFGKLAMEYGSIDIYAKRLSIIEKHQELNDLKYCLSVFFDIWENFISTETILKYDTNNISNNGIYFEKIDKRYFALLSVLLEKVNKTPKLNENVSFLTWNYDLQLESSFESFLPYESSSMKQTNENFNFMNLPDCDKRKEIIHLNGFRGNFRHTNNFHETVEKKFLNSLEEYLYKFLQNFDQFNETDYSNSIKYSWEIDSNTKENALNVMRETNILVIIGYSFPAFNRKIDSELIREFEKKDEYKKVYYQDPFGNLELINLLFSNSSNVEHISNSSQFHIPHEFLFPTPASEPYI
ncbi:hypothetical protein [Flavobacterium filum]|uniref:hypothetical protein n=1 Tax=Flavobacterium TaxID=237 RepID=UPI00041E91F4|nr:hypothetical protein [Flavobacterium filum]